MPWSICDMENCRASLFVTGDDALRQDRGAKLYCPPCFGSLIPVSKDIEDIT